MKVHQQWCAYSIKGSVLKISSTVPSDWNQIFKHDITKDVWIHSFHFLLHCSSMCDDGNLFEFMKLSLVQKKEVDN